MTRAEIEYTLRAGKWCKGTRTIWYPSALRSHKFARLGRDFVLFADWIQIPYSDLTPEKWEQYTGLKFHRRKKEK